MQKTCTKCKLPFELSRFTTKKRKLKNGNIKVYHISECKTCENKRKYLSKTNTPEKLCLYKQRSNERRKKNYNENKERDTLKVNTYIQKLIETNKFKEKWIKYKYKISLEEYTSLINIQNNSCAICGIHQDNCVIALAIDHCHTTNKVRGLLCNKCNRGIGYLNESQEIMMKAIDYINKHK